MGCLGYDNLYNSLQYVLMRWDVYTIIMNRQIVILLPPFFFTFSLAYETQATAGLASQDYCLLSSEILCKIESIWYAS